MTDETEKRVADDGYIPWTPDYVRLQKALLVWGHSLSHENAIKMLEGIARYWEAERKAWAELRQRRNNG